MDRRTDYRIRRSELLIKFLLILLHEPAVIYHIQNARRSVAVVGGGCMKPYIRQALFEPADRRRLIINIFFCLMVKGGHKHNHLHTGCGHFPRQLIMAVSLQTRMMV